VEPLLIIFGFLHDSILSVVSKILSKSTANSNNIASALGDILSWIDVEAERHVEFNFCGRFSSGEVHT